MLREVDLLSYLPEYVREYREIKHIMNTENIEIQRLEDATEVLKNNLFILSCDEIGIARYEKLLHITPNADDSLEARVSRVLTRWNDSIPYTYRGLIEKLTSLCGSGNFSLFPEFDEYKLTIMTSLNLSGQADELDYLLGYMIPANIEVKSVNMMDRKLEGTVFTASSTVTTRKFEVTSQTIKTEFIDSVTYPVGAIATNIERIIN